MQRRLGALPQRTIPPFLQRIPDPSGDLLVGGSGVGSAIGGEGRGGGSEVGGFGLVGVIVVFFCDSGGFEEGDEPGVADEHGVGGALGGDFVETGGDEVVGLGGEGGGGEGGGVAVDDGLGVGLVEGNDGR